MNFKETWENVISVLETNKAAIDMNVASPDIAAFDYSEISSNKAIRVNCAVDDELMPSELSANNNYCTVLIFVVCAANTYIEAKSRATHIALKVRKIVHSSLNPASAVKISDFDEAATNKSVVLVSFQKYIGDI